MSPGVLCLSEGLLEENSMEEGTLEGPHGVEGGAVLEGDGEAAWLRAIY